MHPQVVQDHEYLLGRIFDVPKKNQRLQELNQAITVERILS